LINSLKKLDVNIKLVSTVSHSMQDQNSLLFIF